MSARNYEILRKRKLSMDGIKLSLKPIFDFYISRSEPKFFKERQQIVIKNKIRFNEQSEQLAED